ncbi:MAG: heavy-metal-associated domain-containing protein [Gemmatimonadetes bacterium]|nr:heavy-metal-associated domain-containing protein [Gemmatimonadota bacterium]
MPGPTTIRSAIAPAGLALWLLILTAGGAPGQGRSRPSGTGDAREPVIIEMVVTGLSCPFCAYGLEKKLRTLHGLAKLEIEAGSGKVTLEFEGAGELTEKLVRDSVRDAGFRVKEFLRAPWIDPGRGR